MITHPFYQIGWSDSHHRDLRLEVHGSVSAPIIRIARYQANGEVTYLNLLLGEAGRLYNALSEVLRRQCMVSKQYQEPDRSAWEIDQTEEPEDDQLGSD